MKTLELLDRIAPSVGYKSRVEAVREMYLQNSFTVKQKRAIELFLFEPTKEQAFKAMDITPKAWLFIRYVVSEDEIAMRVNGMIERGKANGTYIRSIVTNKALLDLLQKLLKLSCGNKLEKQMKKIEMTKKLKR